MIFKEGNLVILKKVNYFRMKQTNVLKVYSFLELARYYKMFVEGFLAVLHL